MERNNEFERENIMEVLSKSTEKDKSNQKKYKKEIGKYQLQIHSENNPALYLSNRRRKNRIMRAIILNALRKKYEGVISECEANIEIYLRNPNGIGEHPEILESIDTQLEKLTAAQEKLEALEKFINQ